MSRAELAYAVNAYLHRLHGLRTCIDETYIGKLERGTHRWPQERYREAFRSVLGAATDADLGFYIIRAQQPPLTEQFEEVTASLRMPAVATSARRLGELDASVSAVRLRLLEGGSNLRQGPFLLDEKSLKAAVRTMRELRASCDYTGFIARAPGLLHDIYLATNGPNGRLALASIIQICDELSFVMRHLGFPADAWIAAEHAQSTAEIIDIPIMSGLAAWTQSQAALTCQAHHQAFELASQGIGNLAKDRIGAAKPVLEGQLHLTCAYALGHLGRIREAVDHLAEAKKIALTTGETDTLGLMFGPTNVSFWHVSFHVQWGDPATAISIARNAQPSLVHSASRQAAFFIDLAKALVLDGNDLHAVRALDRVEHLAPQKYANSPEVANLVTILTHRPRRASNEVHVI